MVKNPLDELSSVMTRTQVLTDRYIQKANRVNDLGSVWLAEAEKLITDPAPTVVDKARLAMLLQHVDAIYKALTGEENQNQEK